MPCCRCSSVVESSALLCASTATNKTTTAPGMTTEWLRSGTESGVSSCSKQAVVPEVVALPPCDVQSRETAPIPGTKNGQRIAMIEENR